MKLNWGTSIAIFYICFMIAMVSMVIKSTYHKAQMVQENYYDKDLNYEAFRLKRERASNLKESIVIEYLDMDKNLEIKFPEDMKTATGNISLFRPSNASLDQSYPIQIDEGGSMLIPIPMSVAKGLWRVQIEWENNALDYYMESVITI